MQNLSLLSLKWIIPALIIIKSNHRIRFNELKKSLPPITSTRLSSTLKKMIENGIVKKKVLHNSPISVEYSLTNNGKKFYKMLKPFLDN